ncbi:hypothetical protein DENIS_1041 [Desulfonema ishimotonii]|uniref:VWFA domain-containing protein n=1 Tax=Desulfonema ishimotonii TaxID=45657 RepID=A0A401FT06_9BACT|nr:VWA domain-containing protein [Desulfonema ishimotonii]GBC60097.1 hypothetical protein DENIS_1041 [Desulfonema ishimotonii]
MKFARVEMLFLIWAVPVLFLVVVYGMRRRRKILSRFAAPRGLKGIAPDTGSVRRRVRAGLLLCALAFTAVALSGPQYGYRWQKTERRGIDIIIALDCSGSMLAEDIRPTRLDRAKREIFDLLSLLQGDRAGLVAFAGTAFLQCPLTLDYETFHIFLNTLTPGYLPVGGTDMGQALETALSGFDPETNSEKAVILITDGENTGAGDPVAAAEALKEKDVKLFCIGVGSEGGVPVPAGEKGFKKDRDGKIVMTRLDEGTLKKMAAVTGGSYVRSVAGDMDLDVIYTREIRGKMARTTLSSGRKQVWEDRYQWALALGVLALLAEIFLTTGRPLHPSLKKIGVPVFLLCLLLAPPAEAGGMRDGLAAYEKGDYENALKCFIDAQLDAPDDPRVLYNLGNTYYRLGDYEAAARNFRAALRSEDPKLKHRSLYNLGNANFRSQQFDKAIENYTEALKFVPDDLQAKQNIEFVKKVKEQKKKEQQEKNQKQDGQDKKSDEDKSQDGKQKSSGEQEKKQDGQDKKSDEDKSQEGEQNSSAGNEKQPNPQKSPSPEYGSEKPENQASGGTPPSPDEEKPGQQGGMAKPGKSESQNDRKQAERILNRLRDQPGRAMMPAYQERHVEKDW